MRDKLLVEVLKDRRIVALILITLLALGNAYFNGVKFGIDFSGGTRIPILLEKPINNPEVMDEMIESIKKRSSAFGLGEVKVRAIGSSEIHVELPSSDPKSIEQTEKLLSQRGVFLGIVDGKVALSGEDIYTGRIERIPTQYLPGEADWGVGFSVTQKGALRFANASYGKTNYPIYMFLDRPSDAYVFISREDLMKSIPPSKRGGVREEEVESAARDALRLENDELLLCILDDFDSYKENLTPKKAIISEKAPSLIKNYLTERGFKIINKSEDEIQPLFSSGRVGELKVKEWKAVGLRSSAFLSPGVTTGVPIYGYQITGPAEGATPLEKAKNAELKVRELESVLKGGAFPVQISIGSKTTIPAPLGAEFLRYSVIGAIGALSVIALMLAIRYRTLNVILPIIFISISEIIILVSVLGSFSIDLGGMAGIIAAIGVSVDAQIVVTDELLKRGGEAKRKLEKAFSIIITNATVAIIAMLPLLLFSGLVEVIGFATASILGSLLGVLISRPAYGAIAEKLFEPT